MQEHTTISRSYAGNFHLYCSLMTRSIYIRLTKQVPANIFLPLTIPSLIQQFKLQNVFPDFYLYYFAFFSFACMFLEQMHPESTIFTTSQQ